MAYIILLPLGLAIVWQIIKLVYYMGRFIMIYIQEGIKGVAIFSSLAIVYCVLSILWGS